MIFNVKYWAMRQVQKNSMRYRLFTSSETLPTSHFHLNHKSGYETKYYWRLFPKRWTSRYNFRQARSYSIRQNHFSPWPSKCLPISTAHKPTMDHWRWLKRARRGGVEWNSLTACTCQCFWNNEGRMSPQEGRGQSQRLDARDAGGVVVSWGITLLVVVLLLLVLQLLLLLFCLLLLPPLLCGPRVNVHMSW